MDRKPVRDWTRFENGGSGLEPRLSFEYSAFRQLLVRSEVVGVSNIARLETPNRQKCKESESPVQYREQLWKRGRVADCARLESE